MSSKDLNDILNTNDPKKISPFMSNSFVNKSDDIVKMDLNDILNTNDPRKISPFMSNSFVYKSDDIVEKVIKICYNKISEETFHKFLSSAIFSDKVNVFQIMDKLMFSYDKVKYLNMSNTYKSEKCKNYFNHNIF